MNFYVMTLFPEMIEAGLNASIIGRAAKKQLITLHTVNIRDFTLNKHKRVDDYPYGGGAGMLMAVEPVVRTYEYIKEEIRKQGTLKEHPRVVYLTPWGHPFSQQMAAEFAREENLVFLCGHYEGIDERALEEVATDFVSIGDYVLTGGELPAMVMIDAISRLVPGVLSNEDSAQYESFSDGFLEHPQYTRPEEYAGRRVPEVLLSGHHAKIEEWRKEQALLRTKKYRPDLLERPSC